MAKHIPIYQLIWLLNWLHFLLLYLKDVPVILHLL
jgi:hypothetical protein